jgi:hypothetical protein
MIVMRDLNVIGLDHIDSHDKENVVVDYERISNQKNLCFEGKLTLCEMAVVVSIADLKVFVDDVKLLGF